MSSAGLLPVSILLHVNYFGRGITGGKAADAVNPLPTAEALPAEVTPEFREERAAH